MDRIFIGVVIVAAFALVQIFMSNPITQKIMPTKTTDGFGKRVGYSAMHRVVLLAIIAAVLGVLALLGIR